MIRQKYQTKRNIRRKKVTLHKKVVLYGTILLFLLTVGFIGAGEGSHLIAASSALQPETALRQSPITPSGLLPAGEKAIPNRYIVVLRSQEPNSPKHSPVGAAAADGVIRDLTKNFSVQVHYVYQYALSGFAATLTADALQGLLQDPRVRYIEPDGIVTKSVEQSPATWGLDRIDQRNLPLDNRYTYDLDGSGVHAYIIDTGIRSTHQEFSGRMGNGFTSINDGLGTEDCDSHGTHVAGTVGGATYGVAKRVTLHPVRVLDCSGSGTNSGVIAGIDWVTANHSKPAVANMSLGGSASTALDNALRASVAAGVTYAVAAGNSSADACFDSPARVAEALTVGATTNSDWRAYFSNYGTCVDIFAPGQSITSSTADSDTATASYSGTSMASPHVAGVAALYAQAHPNASPSQVMAAILDNATTNGLINIGSGSPNKLLYADIADNSGNTPTPTPTGNPTATPTATPTQPAAHNSLKNGFLDQGANGDWTEESTVFGNYAGALILSEEYLPIPPHSGTFVAWLGGAMNETSLLSQPVATDDETATLAYY